MLTSHQRRTKKNVLNGECRTGKLSCLDSVVKLVGHPGLEPGTTSLKGKMRPHRFLSFCLYFSLGIYRNPYCKRPFAGMVTGTPFPPFYSPRSFSILFNQTVEPSSNSLACVEPREIFVRDNRFNFTQERIRKIPTPPQGRSYFYDNSEANLELQVSKTGSKTFYFCGRIHGRPDRILIGKFPDMAVRTAQNRTIAMRLAIAEGRDPREATPSAGKICKSAVTLNEFLEIYVDRYAKENRDNWKSVQRDFKNYFKPLAAKPLAAISPDLVLKWHKQLGDERGHATADKQINLLRAIYNKAMKWKDHTGRHYADTNPAVAGYVDRFGNQSRDRYITAQELPAAIQSITTHETSGARHFFQLALFTGARKSNLMKMSFSDIDIENWIWTIPREQFKGQKGKRHPHPVPLVTQAQEIIQIRRQMLIGDWVFPGRRKNGKPIGNVNCWWTEIKAIAEIEDVTIHDLRRTIASWMAMTGASYPIIAQLLGHTLPGATQIYARLAVEPVRERVQIAVDRILEVAESE